MPFLSTNMNHDYFSADSGFGLLIIL